MSNASNGSRLPPGATALNLLGVNYVHLKTADGGDLYLTRFGIPFREHLAPENWFEKSWFEGHRERLSGTSMVYRVKTRAVRGRPKELVVKWCRVGEEVPFDTFTFSKFAEAEFNSPYEEFALVMEMRDDPSHAIVRTHKPLAIYAPAKKLDVWQTGRSQTKIDMKKAKYRDVELDICRQYILIYEWVKGISCPEAFHQLAKEDENWRERVTALTEQGIEDLRRKGFRVLDMKPEHVIVRTRGGDVMRTRDGKAAYALVDFELLERTPEREREVTSSRRAAYLKHQKDRFVATPETQFPEHLKPASALGVEYVYGHSESTQGGLWVVGKDPALFDYFLPERWRRTQRRRLSQTNEVYHTKTKDNINLVWKVSRVGEILDIDSTSEQGMRIVSYGFNSPFEEFALAIELSARGFPTAYPRAIYMTGQEAVPDAYNIDYRRYESHAHILTPEGAPALSPDHNYIMVWGFWNGLDEMLARVDADYCRGINLLQAREEGYISNEEFGALLARAAGDLARLGFEDLNLKGSHFLLSLTPNGELIRNDDGALALRMCNFGLVKRIDA